MFLSISRGNSDKDAVVFEDGGLNFQTCNFWRSCKVIVQHHYSCRLFIGRVRLRAACEASSRILDRSTCWEVHCLLTISGVPKLVALFTIFRSKSRLRDLSFKSCKSSIVYPKTKPLTSVTIFFSRSNSKLIIYRKSILQGHALSLWFWCNADNNRSLWKKISHLCANLAGWNVFSASIHNYPTMFSSLFYFMFVFVVYLVSESSGVNALVELLICYLES